MPVLDPELFVRERRRQRMSRLDLAARAGLSPVRMDQIESGGNAAADEVEAIAGALGVAVSDIEGNAR